MPGEERDRDVGCRCAQHRDSQSCVLQTSGVAVRFCSKTVKLNLRPQTIGLLSSYMDQPL